MTDAERERIRKESREEAEMENRVRNLEDNMKVIHGERAWVLRAIWGGAVYLALKVWEFVAGGGVLK